MFTREMIANYMWKKEKALLDELASVVQAPAFANSLYGRNGRDPSVAFGECDESATWSLCGYGSDQALVDMALRHNHNDVLVWLKKKAKFAVSIVPWWLQKFGKPCGEDAWLEPCHPRGSLSSKQHGDTDIQRHWDSFGLHQASMLAVEDGDITKIEAVELAFSLFNWTQAGAFAALENRREYLRYGNRINSLCGMYDVLDKYANDSLVDLVWTSLKSFVYWAYAPINSTNDGPWPMYSYGQFKYDENKLEWVPAFRYGWWPYGGQAWYHGHNLIGLFHVAERAAWRGDIEFLKFVISVIDTQTRWLDVAKRHLAPVAFADDGVEFSNALIQGGLPGKATDPYLTKEHMQFALTPEDFKALRPADEFYRFTFVNHHEADTNAYHSTTITDPVGQQHDRTHYRYKYGYTGRPNLDLTNSYGCCEGVWARALLYPTPERVDWAYIVPMTLMAYGNRSDVKVRVDSFMSPLMGASGCNLIGGFNRPYHWFLQIGMNLRKHWISNGKPVMQSGGDSLSVFGQVMSDLR